MALARRLKMKQDLELLRALRELDAELAEVGEGCVAGWRERIRQIAWTLIQEGELPNG